MTFWALSALINAIAATGFGLFVYLNNRKNPTNISWGLFTLTIAFWSYSYFLWQISTEKPLALFWCRSLTVGSIFIPVVFLHFLLVWLDMYQAKKKLLFICYFICLIAFGLNFTPLFVKDVSPISFFKYWPRAGVAYLPFLTFWAWLVVYCWYIMFRAMQSSSPTKRNQIKYVLLAAIIGFGGGFTNYPLWYEIEIPPYGNILVSVYVGLMAYAIIRHQLMEIEVLIKKTVVFASLFATVFGVFIGITLLTQELIAGGRLLGLAISSIVIIFAVRPLEDFLINATDKYLFQKKYNPAELIKTFSKTILTELDLDKIAKSTVDKLVEALKLTSCALLVPSKEGNKFAVRKSHGIESGKILYDRNAPMISYLSNVNSVILKENKKPLSEVIIKDMSLIGANACLAIMMRKELIGVLCLGRKKSDEEYTKDDIDILLLLADALGVAITNALAFEDVRQKEKLAAIGMLAAGIKHDIGTPINKMSSAIQLFLMERDDGDHKKTPMSEVLSSAYDLLSRSQMTLSQVSRISAKFADFARPKRQAELELVNVSESIEEALSVLDCDIHARGVSVKKNIQKHISPVIADREYMQEILFNIIKNAAQAIHEAHRSKDESIITITAKEEPKRNVVVEIKDTGVGIPEDRLNKVFEEYYTTKQERGGTGLGLAIVKELVGRNKGKISVKSELGKGSTFILEFLGAEQ